jgi:hypothetical protein
MTSMPADHFGLRGPGRVGAGAADVVALDLDGFEDRSTLRDPVNYVRGVDTAVSTERSSSLADLLPARVDSSGRQSL